MKTIQYIIVAIVVAATSSARADCTEISPTPTFSLRPGRTISYAAIGMYLAGFTNWEDCYNDQIGIACRAMSGSIVARSRVTGTVNNRIEGYIEWTYRRMDGSWTAWSKGEVWNAPNDPQMQAGNSGYGTWIIQYKRVGQANWSSTGSYYRNASTPIVNGVKYYNWKFCTQ